MKIVSIIKNIWNHPMNRHGRLTALLRFLRWQIGYRIIRYPVIYPYVEGSVLVLEKGMAGATGNLYNGLHEYGEMLFLLHFLRRDDFFVDIGANVGTYSVLASCNCMARVASFEPVPETFNNLKRNILVNNVGDRVTLHNLAVGKEEKSLNFTRRLDAMNHAVAQEEIMDGQEIISVPCKPLDDVLSEPPVLIKIDVEGFETEVIAGGGRVFSSSTLQAIIIELNGLGSRYGFNEGDIHDKLIEFGFIPYRYDPFLRELLHVKHWGTHNTIYLRDENFVKERLKQAKKIKINNLVV